jgi:hypothetical protein
MLNGRWCNVVVPNVHAPCEGENGDVKDSLCEELWHVLDQLPRYNIKNFLGVFNAKVDREGIFTPTVRSESSHEISNDSGITVVHFVTPKNSVVRSTMFSHRNIHKYTCTSPEGKTRNKVDHVLVDRRRHSNILYVRYFMGADCDTDYNLVVAKIGKESGRGQTSHTEDKYGEIKSQEF